MAFQFYCPNGHLLQANEDQIGQTCICPSCQVEIIIPSPGGIQQGGGEPSMQPALPTPPPGQPPISAFTPSVQAPVQSQISAQAGEQQLADPFQISKKKKKKFDFGSVEENSNGEKPAAEINIADPDSNKILHCLCPSGHSLAIEREMIGQQAMCPYCQKTFEIRMDRTVEHITKKRREAEVAEKKMANLWFQWAIITAILAVVFIIIMITLMVTRG